MFSTKAIMVKLAYQHGISPVPILMLRMLFALPVYLIMMLFTKPENPKMVQKKDYLWIVVLGFIGYYLASYFDFAGLVYIKAGLERLILFVYPTLVLIISWIVFRKAISRQQLISIGLTYLGIVIAFVAEINIEDQRDVVIGSSLIFLSALCYACYLIGLGKLVPKFGPVALTNYTMVISTLCVIVHFLLVSPDDPFSYSAEVYGLGLLMATVSTVIPSYLVSEAIKRLGSSNFAIVGSLGPISTIVLASIYLNETITGLQILGTVIVIAGVGVISIRKKDKIAN